MSADATGPLPIGKAVERVGGIVELLTTLDQKILRALDSLEEMQGRIAGFDDVGTDGRELIADIRDRFIATDARINRDLDDIKEVLMAKLGELDVGGVGRRLDRLEEAIYNIERATMNLDKAFEGSLEMLPNFLSRRLQGEKKKAPQSDESPPDPHDTEGGPGRF